MLDTETWVLILTLSLLVAVILGGLLIIYIYSQKIIQLYRLQQNFINGFTHELKTPIASLQLFLETFTRHELPRDEQLKYLNYMKQDTKRLSDNVIRILQLGRLEEKNFRGDFNKEDVVDVIKNFITNTPHLFDQGKVEFETEMDHFWYQLDHALFEMLLMNFVTNAFIYNKSSEKLVLIKLRKEGRYVVLDFIDNGIGLEKNELKKVFKKFYQVGQTAKGNGLGLYIVANIARVHNAEVMAFSQGHGTGSTFRVIFRGPGEY